MNDIPLFMHDDYWPPPAGGGFVRPQWKAIADIIEDTRSGAARNEAWAQARERWISQLIATLNLCAAPATSGQLNIAGTTTNPRPRFPYCASRSEHFLIVAPYKQDVTEDVAALGENFRRLAISLLGPQLTADPPMGHVVLILHSMAAATAYLEPLGVNARAIAGVCFGGAGPHIVMHDAQRFRLKLTLLHELNHALLHQLSIPSWVHEGLSRYFESRLLSMANMRFTAEMDVGRNKFWRGNGLADFWNGAVFYDSRAGHGYVLAHKLILRILKSHPEGFAKFMLQARQEDAGDAACREIFGMGILEMARDLLGPHEWEGPRVEKK